MSQGYVYAIRTRGAEYVKVGMAVNIANRLSQMQTGSAHRLWVYASREVEDSRSLEARLHNLLAPHQVPDAGGREWFYWNKESREIIRSHLVKCDNKEDKETIRWQFHAQNSTPMALRILKEYADDQVYKRHEQLLQRQRDLHVALREMRRVAIESISTVYALSSPTLSLHGFQVQRFIDNRDSRYSLLISATNELIDRLGEAEDWWPGGFRHSPTVRTGRGQEVLEAAANKTTGWDGLEQQKHNILRDAVNKVSSFYKEAA